MCPVYGRPAFYSVITTATFIDDTVIIASDLDAAVATAHLQHALHDVTDWLKRWKFRVNEEKSTYITFITRKGRCPPVTLNDKVMPQADDVKHLEIHLGQRLT